MDKAREIALKTLYKIEEKDAYSNLVLDEMLTNARKTWKEMNRKRCGFYLRNSIWNSFMETNNR